jgi:drug/metabolite transporter (DMT)-like permease
MIVTQWLLVAAIVGCTAIGDVLMSTGMRLNGEVEDLGPRGVMRFLTGPAAPYIATAVFFMAISFFSFLQLLAAAPLSFAVPATAASFVIETVLARVYLKENVDARRWAGALLVACGVALLAV